MKLRKDLFAHNLIGTDFMDIHTPQGLRFYI